MSDQPWLEIAARFYDLDLRGHDEDVAFWVSLARHVAGPVLEIGCGTGRIAVALAAEGVAVTGVDVSPAMLARARARAEAAGADGLTLVEGDVRTLDLGAQFDLVAVPLAGFCHLLTAEDQLAALRSMRRHLAPHGLVALDLPLLEPAQWQPSDDVPRRREWRRKDQAGRVVEKYASASPDFARQRQAITYEYRVEGEPGPVRFSFELRYVFPAEVEHLLARAGLVVESVYGSYDLDPFEAGSSRMLVIAREETSREG